MKILCFGDSNTCGYDPRSFGGGRYPERTRWTGLLNRPPEWEIVNCGENGREIPRRESELEQAARLLDRIGPDLLLVMLGGNDLLTHPEFSAEDVTARMEVFLTQVPRHPAAGSRNAGLLLIAPPPMKPGAWVAEERLLTQSARLGGCYEGLARRLGIGFADAGAWDIPLAFDGVHFSEEGHRHFAGRLRRILDEHSPSGAQTN